MELTLVVCALLLVAFIAAGYAAQTHNSPTKDANNQPITWQSSIEEKREESKRLAMGEANFQAIQDQFAVRSYDMVKKGNK